MNNINKFQNINGMLTLKKMPNKSECLFKALFSACRLYFERATMACTIDIVMIVSFYTEGINYVPC